MADLPPPGATSFTRQQLPLGLGHAVWCAREIVGDEPFAVLLPDMVTKEGERGGRCLAQCVDAYDRFGGNVLAVEEVAPEETHQYGVVAVGADDGHTFEITGMVEKPKPGKAPSNLIISGRYILQPEIFQILELVEKGAGGEVQLTDGMIQLARTQKFHGVLFDGSTYDCGSQPRLPHRQPRLRPRPPRSRAGAEGGIAQARIRARAGVTVRAAEIRSVRQDMSRPPLR